MLACIACSKPELEEEGVGGDVTARAGTPRNKDAVKSLTSQIKDMVLKFSGAHRQCKGGGGGGGGGTYRYKGGHQHQHSSSASYMHPHDDEETESERGGHCAYLTSSNSTPAWDFTSIGGTSESRPKWIPGMGFPPEEEEVVLEDDNGEPKEWMAQVEPGVHITFVSLPGGTGNDLKRIRFSREMFNKWQAQRWWGENYDRIMELYNVQRFSSQALPTPPRSDDGQRESFYSRTGSTTTTTRGESPATPPLAKDRSSSSRNTYRHPTATSPYYLPSVPDPSEHILPHHLNFFPGAAASTSSAAGPYGMKGGEASSVDAASRTTTSSRDDAPSISISNASDLETTEWVEQDEPGVYITIRELSDGTRELRRVRFSRERFGEVHAKLWWEENRERIQAQYL